MTKHLLVLDVSIRAFDSIKLIPDTIISFDASLVFRLKASRVKSNLTEKSDGENPDGE